MSKENHIIKNEQNLVNSNNRIQIHNQKPHRTSSCNFKSEETKTHWFELLPLLFIVVILPLIVRLHQYETPLTEFPWFTYNNLYVDFFLYYKQLFFIIISIFMVIVIAVKAFLNNRFLKFSPIFIPLALYALLALLSSIFSKYRIYSLAGTYEQFESIFVLLGYCLVVYYVYLFVQSEKDVKLIINGLIISSIILGFIGISQFLGHDFFATEIGLKLMTPRIYWGSLDSINFTFGKNRVYLSLYNPNYVGVYVALVLPILIVLTIFNKNIKKLPLFLIAIIGLLISLIGSQSKTGLIALTIALLLFVIIFWRVIIKYFYIVIPFILICVTSIFLINKCCHSR